MVEQLSVFLENESGRLAEVAGVLARSAINLRALALADMAEFGILRLIVDDPTRTRAVLREAGFTVGSTEVIAAAVPDRPGGVAAILDALRDGEVDVEYMYAFARKSGEDAIIILRVDEVARGVEALRRAGVRLLGGDEIDKL